MRFLLEMVRDEEGRIVGSVHAEGDRPASFSGWLELLRLLEDRAEMVTERGGPAPQTGDETGE